MYHSLAELARNRRLRAINSVQDREFKRPVGPFGKHARSAAKPKVLHVVKRDPLREIFA